MAVSRCWLTPDAERPRVAGQLAPPYFPGPHPGNPFPRHFRGCLAAAHSAARCSDPEGLAFRDSSARVTSPWRSCRCLAFRPPLRVTFRPSRPFGRPPLRVTFPPGQSLRAFSLAGCCSLGRSLRCRLPCGRLLLQNRLLAPVHLAGPLRFRAQPLRSCCPCGSPSLWNLAPGPRSSLRSSCSPSLRLTSSLVSHTLGQRGRYVKGG